MPRKKQAPKQKNRRVAKYAYNESHNIPGGGGKKLPKRKKRTY